MIMTGKNGKTEKIVLADNLTSLSFLENISKEKNVKIISFDYKTHTKLVDKKIQHEISENYLNQDNVEILQKKCYEFAKWYNLKIVDDCFVYSGINIAKLFTDQFMPSFISILKKFSECQKIYKIYSPSMFLASGDLLNIIKLFSNSFFEIKENQEEQFYFDKVNLNFQIWKKNFSFSISKSFYESIKNKFDIIFYSFFGIGQNKSNSKYTLFVELNTKNFADFYLTSNQIKKNILYYGRRRPPIWDLETAKIIKNSGCKLFRYNSFKVNTNNLRIKIENFKQQFLELLDNVALENFFKIDNFSIIPIIRPKLKHLIYPKIENSIFEIELAKNIFKEKFIDSVVVLSEIGITEQIICNLARQNKIPIFHLQEGFHYDTLEIYDRMKTLGGFTELAQKYFAWGDISKNYAINIGKINSDKIIESGSPRFSSLEFNENENKNDFILLATMPPQIEEINGINTKNLESYYQNIEKICEIVTKNNKQLVIKLHPTSDVLEISKNIPKKFPDVKVLTSGDINSLIRSCSCLIVTGISTVIIQGQILQKPVISIPLIEYNFGTPSIYQNEGCKLSTISELEILLDKIENDSTFRDKVIENGNKFLNVCIKNRTNSSSLTWNYIKKFLYENKS
jgi:hypothetical protein